MSRTLPTSKQFIYAIGVTGLWTIWQMLGYFLVNFYIPPKTSNIPILVSQSSILFIFNIVAILQLCTRAFDAVTDPIIGNLSDRLRGKLGRRKPFLIIGLLSAVVFVLAFMPIHHYESATNVYWLFAVLLLFYLFFTCYFVPYYALMADLSVTNADRINIATWAGVGISLGAVIAALAPLIWTQFEAAGYSALVSRQWAFAILAGIAFILLLIPILAIKEPKIPENSNRPPLWESIKQALENSYFRTFFVVFILYSISMAIIIAGTPYNVTVLLQLPAKVISLVAPLMILTSFITYPFANLLSKKIGKKKVYALALVTTSMCFIYVVFLGDYHFGKMLQISLAYALFGIPIGFVNVVLNAMCIDIAQHASKVHQHSTEGIFFGGKNFALKLGITLGMAIFACFTLLGKDIGNALGLRLSYCFGAVVILVGCYYLVAKYNEKKLYQELEV